MTSVELTRLIERLAISRAMAESDTLRDALADAILSEARDWLRKAGLA